VPELIRGKTGRVFGDLLALLTIMKGLPLAYNRDLQEDKLPMFDSADTVKGSLKIMGEIVGGLKIRRERMLAAAQDGYMNATDLADYLVERGIPFRQAHEVSGKIVRLGMALGKRIEELSLVELRAFSKKIDKDIYNYLSTASVVERRRALGGTSTVNVVRRLKELGV
jgi:argininosuccinate lyase